LLRLSGWDDSVLRLGDVTRELEIKNTATFVVFTPLLAVGLDYTFCDHLSLLNSSRTPLVVVETHTLPLHSGFR